MDSAHLTADPAFKATHDALLRQSDIQFGFPEYKPPQIPDWFKFLEAEWTPIKVAIWIIAAIIVIWVAITLIRQYWRPFWRKRTEKPAEARPAAAQVWRPAPAQARQLLNESDALAARGLYSQAVHLLLLRSIEEIETRQPRLVRPTLTSREIGLLGDLPDAARPAFRGIARVVEHALFAGLPVSAEEFARCRADYEAFAFPRNWQIGAAL